MTKPCEQEQESSAPVQRQHEEVVNLLGEKVPRPKLREAAKQRRLRYKCPKHGAVSVTTRTARYYKAGKRKAKCKICGADLVLEET